jgi:anthranilate phosphoribosyltransferase
MASLKELLKPMTEIGTTLTREQARQALKDILAGEVSELEIAALLTAMATRGETSPELTGFAETMRELSVPVPLTVEERADLLDTCGTGGGGPETFNISTGAALVAAAAGAKVAKHGNRGVTSKCGSADVLEALGVSTALSPELAVECLRETGFMFLYAPALHPALKRVQPIRKALGFRTIFNLAGPLTNPAGARAQVIGVISPGRVLLVARALAELGVNRAFVVHGTDGMDELTLTGESIAARIEGRQLQENGEPALRAARIVPEMAGLGRAKLEDFSGGDAATNASILYDIITGLKGPRRDIVLLNAAAALVAVGMADDLMDGVAQGAEAIDSGMAAVTLEKLRRFSQKVAQSAK